MSNFKKIKNITISKDLPEVQEHYQDYPYPFRDPNHEKERLLTICGEFLGELNHFLYKGKENFNNNFRCLIAGGGTGDSAIYLAEQLKDKNAEIIYLDFSKPSMEIAQKRAEVRGLKNIKWIHNSILNIPNLKLGKFDYINCTGVLHHLANPDEGLKNLKASLKPTGGMGLMVYAKYGRTGVYQIQDLMKMINKNAQNRIEEIMNGKLILDNLPATNWYKRGWDLFSDYQNFGDIGVYDMFLHKQDRAYSIPELYEFIEKAGLNFVDYLDPLEKILLRTENYIKDFSLLQKVKQMDKVTQEAISEILTGNIIKHSFYVSNQKASVASLDNLDNIPYFHNIVNFAKQIYEYLESNSSSINVINFTINNGILNNINISMSIFRSTKYIFKYMIEEKSLREIFDAVRSELNQEISDEALLNEVKNVFMPLLHTNVLLLKSKYL
ncbi:Putative methyltransferase [Rickettsia prowazekii str. Rp22]|uniref:Methyltransferase n=1 Tax=Rickettsia prowazekii (strain Rp22) TaxID=449216 RepID=D5AXB5_RICPP|nr:class I SAM-dependent methyltransferase [Rickettsia prowazekii]ADE30054.1 Putative methyltransferase [Rickettsia prowazekii str. Rp22]